MTLNVLWYFVRNGVVSISLTTTTTTTQLQRWVRVLKKVIVWFAFFFVFLQTQPKKNHVFRCEVMRNWWWRSNSVIGSPHWCGKKTLYKKQKKPKRQRKRETRTFLFIDKQSKEYGLKIISHIICYIIHTKSAAKFAKKQTKKTGKYSSLHQQKKTRLTIYKIIQMSIQLEISIKMEGGGKKSTKMARNQLSIRNV